MRTAAARHQQFGIGNLLRRSRPRLGLTPRFAQRLTAMQCGAVHDCCWLLPIANVEGIAQFVTGMSNLAREPLRLQICLAHQTATTSEPSTATIP